jgi:hypothetical protein
MSLTYVEIESREIPEVVHLYAHPCKDLDVKDLLTYLGGGEEGVA